MQWCPPQPLMTQQTDNARLSFSVYLWKSSFWEIVNFTLKKKMLLLLKDTKLSNLTLNIFPAIVFFV